MYKKSAAAGTVNFLLSKLVYTNMARLCKKCAVGIVIVNSGLKNFLNVVTWRGCVMIDSSVYL
jgi:hypothetical protein